MKCDVSGCVREVCWDIFGTWACQEHTPTHAAKLALVHAKFEPGLTDNGALVLRWPFAAPREVLFEYDERGQAVEEVRFEHSSHEARLYIALPRGSTHPVSIVIDRSRLECTSRSPPRSTGPGFYLREEEESARRRHERMQMIAREHQRHAPEPPKIDGEAELARLGEALKEIGG